MACHALTVQMGRYRRMWQGKDMMTESSIPFLDVFSVPLKLLDFLFEIGFVLLLLSSTVRVVHLRVCCAFNNMKSTNDELEDEA